VYAFYGEKDGSGAATTELGCSESSGDGYSYCSAKSTKLTFKYMQNEVKVVYQKREFLANEPMNRDRMQTGVVSSVIVERYGLMTATFLITEDVQGVLTSREDAERLLSALAKVEDHARSLRGEILKLTFEENKTNHETNQ
jgi:hypothetical protein